MHLAPIFEKKLARRVLELDHPGWVDADEPRFRLSSASTPRCRRRAISRQLEELVGHRHSVPLDRTQPLWQFTIIDGLDDGNVAIYAKMHHAAVDGGAGMAIAGALYDMAPVPRKVKPPEPKKPVRKPSIEERAILGINDVIQSIARQQIKALEALPQMLGTLTDLLAPPKPGEEAPAARARRRAFPACRTCWRRRRRSTSPSPASAPSRRATCR